MQLYVVLFSHKIFLNRNNYGASSDPFPHNDDFLTPLRENKSFENIVGKEQHAGDQHFLLFPQCFLPLGKQL